ncbi:MAG: tetratricopeptide repeat protein [Myxococcota bacterium]
MSADDERIRRFEDLKARFPDMEQPRWSLATAFEQAGRHEDAIREFRELVEIKPDYCVAFLHLGSCLIETEDYEEALEALQRAHDLAVQQGHSAPKQEAEMLLEQARDEMDE